MKEITLKTIFKAMEFITGTQAVTMKENGSRTECTEEEDVSGPATALMKVNGKTLRGTALEGKSVLFTLIAD